MGIKEFFQTIQWGPTLQIAAIRIVIASILWPLLFIILGDTKAVEFFSLVLGFLLVLAAFIAIAIPAIGLARANVPFVGLAALPAWMVVIADPFVKLIHSNKPEWVPVDEFNFINPPVLAVFGTDDSQSHAENAEEEIVRKHDADSKQVETPNKPVEEHGSPKEDLNEMDESYKENQIIQENPMAAYLIMCDHSPQEGLAVADTFEPELKENTNIIFGRFVAHRHLALDVFLKNNDDPCAKLDVEILEKLDEEKIYHVKQALELASVLESKEPGFFDNLDQGDVMLKQVCLVNECLKNGSTQEVLGWTKLVYFGRGRNGNSPDIHFEESDNIVLRSTMHQKIEPDKIIRSSMTVGKGKDEKNRRYIDYILMEKDYNDTETIGDANVLYDARIFDDGAVLLSPCED